MYFPYFRGRQYELLALKELAIGRLLSKSIIPVVEPIKITSTFDGTLRAFAENESQFALVFNPAVGALSGGTRFIDSFLSPSKLIAGTATISPSILPTFLMNNSTEEVIKVFEDRVAIQSDIITILDKRDFLDVYKTQFATTAPKFTLFPDEREFRRIVKNGKVMFRDNFNKQIKNADYPDDEFYTEDHKFFKDEGYLGFGDYSIIGSEYSEKGFAPYAVAIHIVYLSDDDILRIHHFKSDSNDDTSDVAGKFSEAVTKLADWYQSDQQKQSTTALQTLLSYAATGYYPGLPTIKKLSIMHQLELIGKYLDGGMS